jgi:hypothetical protein
LYDLNPERGCSIFPVILTQLEKKSRKIESGAAPFLEIFG